MNNPYSIAFGTEPSELISRGGDIDKIIDTFNSPTPSTTTYIITGVRGSGKTVTMAKIIEQLRNDKGWIAITLNQNRDLLTALAANLYEHPMLKSAFLKADIKISFLVETSIKSEGPAEDVEVQLKKMLQIVKRMKKKVLIAVDEAVNNSNFRVFASSYQMFLIEKFPVFLVMTGLYNNINALQNEKTLTFLYRAPKYELKPLNMIAMSNSFMEKLDIPQTEADEMARLTKGYSYAFQVIGYLKYENKRKRLDELLPKFDEIMDEYSYSKIWNELTGREREVVEALFASEEGRMKVKEIKDATGLTDQSFPTYRRRLGGSGVISISEYGYCELALPRFKEIVSRMWE